MGGRLTKYLPHFKVSDNVCVMPAPVPDALKKTIPASSLTQPEQPATTAPKQLPWPSRVVYFFCGLAMTVGFFLPWVIAGTTIELSGMGLVFSGGELVRAISGAGRFLLFLVPLLGIGLSAGAITGHRLTSWAAAIGAGFLLLFGAVNLILLFISSTGLGMWLVVFASLGALVMGMLSVGRRSAGNS